MKMTAVKERQPEPHRRYMVQRGQRQFVGTPCYGLHAPWWVPMEPEGEGDPVAMEDGDQWIVMSEIIPEPEKSRKKGTATIRSDWKRDDPRCCVANCPERSDGVSIFCEAHKGTTLQE